MSMMGKSIAEVGKLAVENARREEAIREDQDRKWLAKIEDNCWSRGEPPLSIAIEMGWEWNGADWIRREED